MNCEQSRLRHGSPLDVNTNVDTPECDIRQALNASQKIISALQDGSTCRGQHWPQRTRRCDEGQNSEDAFQQLEEDRDWAEMHASPRDELKVLDA